MFTTFVINLDKDKERMEHMRNQLTQLSINYRRQAGFLGKEYTPTKKEYDEELAMKNGGHKMIPGEVGCALSHAKVLELIVSERIPYTLILEDDVLLPKDFKSIVESEILKNKNGKRWEYLLFDYVPVGRPFLDLWWGGIKRNFLTMENSTLLEKIMFILTHILKAFYIVPLSLFEKIRNTYKRNIPGPVRFFRPVYFAGAYVVTLTGAQKLYSLTRPVIYTADHLPNRARVEKKLKFRCYAPLVVSQERTEFGSSILNLTGKQVSDLFKSN